jgi:hypothetical protein
MTCVVVDRCVTVVFIGEISCDQSGSGRPGAPPSWAKAVVAKAESMRQLQVDRPDDAIACGHLERSRKAIRHSSALATSPQP